MSKRSLIKGVLIGAGIVIGLLVMFFFVLPYVYLYTENRNFAELRVKSELICEKMPLHCLVRDENIAEIRKYAKNGKDLELKDNWGKTALFWALDKEKYRIVQILLSLKADPNAKDDNGISVFHQAVISGKYDIADELLDRGADINGFNGRQHPETTLHYCVMKNKPECVQYLVIRGADKTLKDSFGYTVLERIRMHDHISKEVGELLVN